jgi:hypothetical protein
VIRLLKESSEHLCLTSEQTPFVIGQGQSRKLPFVTRVARSDALR